MIREYEKKNCILVEARPKIDDERKKKFVRETFKYFKEIFGNMKKVFNGYPCKSFKYCCIF